MTLILGIKCKGGYVVASDGAATFGTGGQTTIRQAMKRKLHLIGNTAIVGVSGPVGIGQRFRGAVETLRRDGFQLDNKKTQLYQTPPHILMDLLRQALWKIIEPELNIARVMSQSVGNGSPLASAICSSLVCCMSSTGPCLISFDHQASPELVSEDLPFIALGSGQAIADPFLAFVRRIFWPDQLPEIEQGVLAAVWTLYHTIATAPGGVSMPMHIIAMTQNKPNEWNAVEMPESEWTQHLEAIKDIEKRLATLPNKHTSASAPEMPPLPTAK